MKTVNFLHVCIYQSVRRSLLGGSNLISTGVSVSIDTFFLSSDLRNQWSKVLEMSSLLNSYLRHGLVLESVLYVEMTKLEITLVCICY